MKMRIAIAMLLSLGLTAQVFAAGDAESGKNKAATCIGCHGPDGNSFNPIWPKLAGQHPDYIVKQLSDFKAGNRKDPIMAGMAAPLSDQDMADLAAYYATQSVNKATPDAALAAAGERIYRGGALAKNLAACTGCHGPSGNGNPSSQFPSLKGQHAAYVAKQLRDFKAGNRGNDLNGMMRDIAAAMSEEEIDAVSAFISGL